jgi:hypothetical protein
MKVKVDIDDIDSFAINEGAELHLAFNLSNLNNICTYHKICKDVNIKWIRDFPMQISYSIDNSLVNLKFYLAPKIADD